MQKEVRGETTHEIKNVYVHTETATFSHFFRPFFPQGTNQTKEKPSFFPKVLVFIMDLLKKPQWGLDSRRQTSLSLAQGTPDNLPRECLGRRQEYPEARKKNGSFNLYIIHKGINFSKYFHTWSFTRFLADFSPAATELRQAVRQRGRWYFDPALTGSVTLLKPVTCANPCTSSGAHSCLLGRVEGLGFFPP